MKRNNNGGPSNGRAPRSLPTTQAGMRVGDTSDSAPHSTESGAKRAVAYMRVSGRGQVDGDGFPRQRDAIRTFARAHRLVVVDEYRDEGVSGATDLDGRAALQQLFDYIAGNGVRVVLVERADRLAQDLMVGEVILARFRDLGVRVLASDGVDLTENRDPTAKLIRQVLAAMAEFDRAITVAKLKASRDRRSREAGRRIEGVKPFGALDGRDGDARPDASAPAEAGRPAHVVSAHRGHAERRADGHAKRRAVERGERAEDPGAVTAAPLPPPVGMRASGSL